MRLVRLLAAPLVLAPLLLIAAERPLPKLPKDQLLPRGADSPGAVTFRHATHVDTSRPDCTPCHPAVFPILKKAAAARRPAITHKLMEAGRSCGTCHNGTAASGFDDCSTCHKAE